MRITLIDRNGLEKTMQNMARIPFEEVALKSLTQMFNRALSNTPKDSGELRLSRMVSKPSNSFDGEFGYTKEYAPHVEYGHRTVDGGFVPGQRFLERNVDTQRPIFHRDILARIKKEAKK